MTDDLAAELAHRIERYQVAYAEPMLRHEDPGPALSDEALSDADRLWEFSQSVYADHLVPAAVGQVLALVRQIRARSVPEARQLPEMAAALGLFSLTVHGLTAEEVHPDWRWLIGNPEGTALHAHYITARPAISGPPMLDRAVELYRAALTADGPAHPDRPLWLSNFSLVLKLRYQRTGNPAELDEAVRAAQDAAAAWPRGQALPAAFATNLEQAAWVRYELRGDPADLDVAVTAARAAVSGEDEHDAPPLPARLDHLTHHLATRADLRGDRADVDEAVETAREALAATPAADPERPARLVEVARRLHTRYLAGHDDVDLDTAVRYGQEASVASVATGVAGRQHALVLSEVARLYLTRHARAWSVDDIEASVRVARAAVDAASAAQRGQALTTLAAALEGRFTAFGDSAALEEAVHVIRQAVAWAEPARVAPEEILVRVLRGRASLGHGADLDEAVEVAGRVVDRTPAGHPELAPRLHTLATVRLDRARLGGPDPAADRSAAVEAAERALALATPGSPRRALVRALLSSALLAQFEATGDRRFLRAALATARQAVEEAAPGGGHPLDACRNLLATVLTAGYQRSGARAEAVEAIGLWRGIAAEPAQSVASRMTAARAWGGLAASLGDAPEALAGYALAVDLLPLLAWRGLDVTGRQRLLADWGGLAQDAAACALAAGLPDRAVSVLEHGRSVLWSQVLASRTDLGVLHGLAPGLADRLADVRAELDRHAGPADPLTADTSRYGSPGDRRLALARQFDALLGQARRLPGMGSLLHTPDPRELYPAVAGGAFVMVNVSRFRCDAIVVTERGAEVVPLPDLTHDDVVGRARRHLASIRAVAPGAGGEAGFLDAVIAREEELAGTLAWLWDTIAAPVLTAIGCARPRPAGVPLPRVWWCPTGLLRMLPLHAAGRHDSPAGEPTALDLVVSSYAPSLRTLAQARDPHRRRDPGRHLVVAAPEVPGLPVLGHAAEEADLLGALLPGTLLSGAAATRSAVLAALAAHPSVHFSCHGRQNLADPATGGIALTDGVLTVADLTAGESAGGEFAFLSACDTAVGGVAVPDESITLAAALHHLGYRRVVGTLWPTLDSAAARVVGQVYGHLTTGGGFHPEHAADALHDAVRQLRESAPATPSAWASFVHVGA
jgi:hypothetical protein